MFLNDKDLILNILPSTILIVHCDVDICIFFSCFLITDFYLYFSETANEFSGDIFN